MNTIILMLISFYQRFLSPYKGFTCAHLVVHQGVSCSQAVKDIIVNKGIINGYPLIKARFKACKQASIHLKKEKRNDRNSSELTECQFLGLDASSQVCGFCACSFFS